MANINFVPDDYVQNNEFRRMNTLCLTLFLIVMTCLGGAFATIRLRYQAFAKEESAVNAKIQKLQVSIHQFERLQIKRKEMMKTALTTAQLLEPIPRSVILASVTNNLPAGTSLTQLDLLQEEKQKAPQKPSPKTTQYEKSKHKNSQQASEALLEQEPGVHPTDTAIQISGIAPSDLQVAEFIENLGNSMLLHQVALVESVEHKVDDLAYRQFKLTAQLRHEVQLGEDQIREIRSKGEHRIGIF